LKVAAVIQARFGSTRLPGKALLPIGGTPLLGHVIRQSLAARRVDQVVLATTEHPEDDPLSELAKRLGVTVFRGSRDDVLNRFLCAAAAVGADVVVRVTGDCPFVCPDLIDEAVTLLLRGGGDGVDAVGTLEFPEGLTTEIATVAVLRRLTEVVQALEDREHVTSYLWRNCGRFRTELLACSKAMGEFAFSVDDREDLEFASAVWNRLGRPGEAVRFPDLVSLLQTNPEIAELSRRIWKKKEGTPSGGVVAVPSEEYRK